MTGLVDVDGFKICMEVYVWLGVLPWDGAWSDKIWGPKQALNTVCKEATACNEVKEPLHAGDEKHKRGDPPGFDTQDRLNGPKIPFY